MRSPHTETGECPPLATREKPAQQQKPGTAKNDNFFLNACKDQLVSRISKSQRMREEREKEGTPKKPAEIKECDVCVCCI